MAGGNFNHTEDKVRPGNYINFESQKGMASRETGRGVMLVPLFKPHWGPDDAFVTISADAPDSERDKVGYSVKEVPLIREGLRNSQKVIVYFVNKGLKAQASIEDLTIEAVYPGTRGNDLTYVAVENPVDGFQISVYLGNELVLRLDKVKTIDELQLREFRYVKFSGAGNLTSTAGVKLAGGTDGICTNADITKYLDRSESVKYNTMAFPVDDSIIDAETALSLKMALKTKINYLRNNVGKYVKAVCSDFKADCEGIINLTNTVELDTGEKLTNAQATAWVAGIDAAASNTQSNTYMPYEQAVAIIGQKTNEQAVEAIKNGEFFFSVFENDKGIEKIGVEYDINSLITYTSTKSKDYSKNRVLRVYDSFAAALNRAIPPNKYDNSIVGWGLMEGEGKKILKQFFDAGAIKNVDYDDDFKVDKVKSGDDRTYFIIGIAAVDSAEKLYFTVCTR